MNVAITGHTKGIGNAIFNYFNTNENTVVGFSRSNGYNISDRESRNRIINTIEHFDIFVNNAYNNFDDSQFYMLEEILNKWKDSNKIIINISTRWTDNTNPYSKSKLKLDQLCESHKFSPVNLINLKPGLTDTTRVKLIKGERMESESIIDVIDFILKSSNKFNVQSISFGK